MINLEEDISLKMLDEMIQGLQTSINYLMHRKMSMITNCKYYEWDHNACEEYCNNDDVKAWLKSIEMDFASETHCVGCICRKLRD